MVFLFYNGDSIVEFGFNKKCGVLKSDLAGNQINTILYSIIKGLGHSVCIAGEGQA